MENLDSFRDIATSNPERCEMSDINNFSANESRRKKPFNAVRERQNGHENGPSRPQKRKAKSLFIGISCQNLRAFNIIIISMSKALHNNQITYSNNAFIQPLRDGGEMLRGHSRGENVSTYCTLSKYLCRIFVSSPERIVKVMEEQHKVFMILKHLPTLLEKTRCEINASRSGLITD